MCNSQARNKSFNKSVRTVGIHSCQPALTSWEFSRFQRTYNGGGVQEVWETLAINVISLQVQTNAMIQAILFKFANREWRKCWQASPLTSRRSVPRSRNFQYSLCPSVSNTATEQNEQLPKPFSDIICQPHLVLLPREIRTEECKNRLAAWDQGEVHLRQTWS